MSEVSTITTNLKSLIGTFLGSSYSELAHATDVEKNTFKGSTKRYGVLPKTFNEVDGVINYSTMDHFFNIVLTDDYGGNPLSDIDKQTKTIALQEKAFSLYKEIVNTKAGTPAIVIHTTELVVAEPEYLEDDHIVVITSTVKIKYRKQL